MLRKKLYMSAEHKTFEECQQRVGGADPDQVMQLHALADEIRNYDSAQVIHAISERIRLEHNQTHVTCAQILARVPDVVAKG